MKTKGPLQFRSDQQSGSKAISAVIFSLIVFKFMYNKQCIHKELGNLKYTE